MQFLPHVQFCNERFLSRFGVDRLLAIAAREFRRRGARISFSCLRYSPELLADLGGKVNVVEPPHGADMQAVEAAATASVMRSWFQDRPDVVVVGGWPFFDLAARSGAVGVPSIFIDAGSVPHDGIVDALLPVQLELRRIRRAKLPFITRIFPISRFIEVSQTLNDRGHSDGVRTVLLGSDHLAGLGRDDFDMLQIVLSIHAQGGRCILSLGRFESMGYKNSSAIFTIFESVRKAVPGTRLLLLARPEDVHVPTELTPDVVFLGHPSDAEIVKLMESVDLGISVSLWEGFNLPLVEMQNVGKPVLAFSVGAHPEVAADPWFLCSDASDMARKAISLLTGQGVPKRPLTNLVNFRSLLPWQQTVDRWWNETLSVLSADQREGRRTVLMDVSNSVLDPANSGVVRVTRRLAAQLCADPRIDLILVAWNQGANCYELTNPDEGYLSAYNGPVDLPAMLCDRQSRREGLERILLGRDPHCCAPPILLFAEVALDGCIRARTDWARQRGFLISFILYDLIPIYHQQHCSSSVIAKFPEYLKQVLVADLVNGISQHSLNDLRKYAREEQRGLPSIMKAIWLPAQFAKSERVNTRSLKRQEIRILCVSTLEPRKNHRNLIKSFVSLQQMRPQAPLKLILVGNRYAGADDIADEVEALVSSGQVSVEWLRVLNDADLERQYALAHFTVYASVVEGFGMPILESLWLGKPCICARDGVMAELAVGGGCLTVDVSDCLELTRAMEKLCFDDGYYNSLCDEIISRSLDSWRDYSDKIANSLYEVGNPAGGSLRRLAKSIASPENETGGLSALIDLLP